MFSQERILPYQIAFLNLPESKFVKMVVEKKIENLIKHFDNIIRCEVFISLPHKYAHSYRLYDVRIHLFMPGKDVVISQNPENDDVHRKLYVAIRDSFNAATTVLHER